MQITHESPRIVPDSPSAISQRSATRDRLRTAPIPDVDRLHADVLSTASVDPLGDVERLGLVLERTEVIGDGDGDRGVGLHRAVLEVDAAAAERLDHRHVVADEEDGPARGGDLVHLAEALALERGVADGQHLVDDQDLGLEVRGDREGQPHVHAARVALDRRVEELLDLRERDDLVEAAGRSRGACMPRIAPFR